MHSVSSSKLKNLFAGIFIIFTFILSIPQPAYAGAVVHDPINYVPNWGSFVANGSITAKEYGADAIAWYAANLIIKKMASQTVNWINSGFKGNPAFVTDPGQFFLNAADNTASQFLSSKNLNQICAPFNAEVRLALVRNYLASPSDHYTCSLSILKNNYEQFANDFSQGGWDAWLEMTQISSNNPYGSYVEARGSLFQKINAQSSKYSKQLEYGRGFLSYEKCKPGYEVTQAQIDASGPMDDSNPYSGYKAGDCYDNQVDVETPGSVIEGQLNQVLGSGNRRIEAADEIDEIISALLNQLMNKAIGGLRGLSQKNTTGQSFSSNLSTEKEKGPSNPGNIVTCTTDPDTTDANGNIIPGQTNCTMTPPNTPQPNVPTGNTQVYCTTDSSGVMTCDTTPPATGGGGGGTPSVEPSSLYAQIVSARGNYGANLTAQELADLLASVARSNSGWGLLSKNSGSNCPSSYGNVACDILFHSPTCTLYDVLIDSDPLTGKATPTWSFAGIGNRNDWIDVGAGGAGTGPCATLISTGGGGTGGGTTNVPEPASLLADLQSERAKYGATMTQAELGIMLNTVAWKNKDAGWGLSYKASGSFCPSPAGNIACDILYYKPNNSLYDVLISWDTTATPTWNKLGPNTNGARPWMPPVQP